MPKNTFKYLYPVFRNKLLELVKTNKTKNINVTILINLMKQNNIKKKTFILH